MKNYCFHQIIRQKIDFLKYLIASIMHKLILRGFARKNSFKSIVSTSHEIPKKN